MGNQRAVLIVRSQPLRTGGKNILADKWSLDGRGCGPSAAGTQIRAPRALHGKVLAEPVGAGQIEPAEIGPLIQGWPSHDVAVGRAQRGVETVVIAHIGQWIDNNVGAVAGGRGGGALGLSAGSCTESQGGKGCERN